jgi:glycosyltransferase involved in cell wall biosynthesis
LQSDYRNGRPGIGPGGATLSVVIPVFNEERGLEQLVARLAPVLKATGLDWEVIFVDDGSRDGTLQLIRALHEREPRLKAIALSRNFGKEIAVAAGLRYASGEATVLMDADLQHPPEIIPELIAGWRDGNDVVYGVRRDRDADSPARRFMARVFYRVFRLISGTRLPKGAGDFRLFSRRALDAMNRLGERARFNKGLYAWIGFKTKPVMFDVPERFAGGGSRWRLRPLARFALDGVTSFSTVPLRVSTYLGLTISALAFSYALWFILKTLLFGGDPIGFPTLIVSIMVLSGVQLISLGVIGEYIGRVYDEVKARPLYLVADELGLDGPVAAGPAEQERAAQRPAAP